MVQQYSRGTRTRGLFIIAPLVEMMAALSDFRVFFFLLLHSFRFHHTRIFFIPLIRFFIFFNVVYFFDYPCWVVLFLLF